jgi:autotransporter-associated beta strand protein
MSPARVLPLAFLAAASSLSGQVLISGSGGLLNETYSTAIDTTGGKSLGLVFQIEYLVVGGGGGGGGSGTDSSAWGGGGGGAGGMRTGSFNLSSTSADNVFAVTVGGGGAGGQRSSNISLQQGGNGGDSVLGSITATGGGGGGAHKVVGNSGGSGGGGGGRGTGNNLRTAGGAGTSEQGSAGGASRDDDSSGRTGGGGGGGAGGLGGQGGTDASVGGNGGLGLASSITGSSVLYAAGGGGGAIDTNSNAGETAGTGGSSIGGNGSTSGNAFAGATNTGSGGGGVGHQGVGGAGGSGVVVLRYKGSAVGSGYTVGADEASGYSVRTYSSGTTTLDLSSLNLDNRLGSVVSSDISGTGALTINTQGTIRYTGNATHSGGTVLSDGNLQLGNGGTEGALSGDVTLASGATLEYNRSADATFSSLSGAGSLVKKASGSLTIGDASSFSGGVTVQAGRIRLGSSGALGSGLVTLSGGSLSSDGSSARTVSNNLSVTAVTTTLGDSQDNGALVLSGTTTLGAGQDRSLSVLSDVTVTGDLTGSVGLLKNGAGTLTLSGTTAYSGTTRINAGTLRILNTHNNGLLDVFSGTAVVGDGGTSGSLGTGNVYIGIGATLVLDRSDSYTVANSLRNWNSAANHGTLVKRGAGTLTLTGTGAAFSNAFVFAGLIKVEQGEVVYNATGRSGSADIIAEVAAGTRFTLVDNSFPAGTGNYYSRVLNTSGAGSVTLTGTAGRSLWGASQLAHTGGTVIDGAALMLSNPNTGFATGSSLVIRGNGVLSNQLSLSLGSVVIESGILSGGILGATSLEIRTGRISNAFLTNSTSVRKTGAGLADLYSGNIARTGFTRVEDGTLVIANYTTLGSGAVEVAGGTMRFAMGAPNSRQILKQSSLLLDGGTLENAANAGVEIDAAHLDLRSGTDPVPLIGAGAMTKTTAGTVVLTQANTKFSGSVTVSDGTLQLGTVTSLGSASVLLEGGTIQLAGTTRVGYFEQTGGTVTGGTLVSSQILTESGTLASVIADDGGLASGILKRTAGLTQVTAANTFTGVVSVQNGTLQLDGAGAFASAARLATRQGGTLDLNGKSQTFDAIEGDGAIALGTGGVLAVDSISSSTFAGTLSGDGSLTKSGAGTLTLTGAASHTGGTSVTGGTLVVNGTLGSGTLAVAAGTTLGGSGTIGGATVISGLHSPGNSPGLQTFNSALTYQTGAEIQWELAAQSDLEADRGVFFDGINVAGNLTFGGPVSLLLAFNIEGSTVDWTDAFWDSGHSWKLFDVGGSITGFPSLSLTAGSLDSLGASLSAVRDGALFNIDLRSGDIFIDYIAPIPEPSTYGLAFGLLALASVAVRRRAQRNRSTE